MDKDSTICWSALAWGQKKEQCCSSRVALRTRPFEKIMGLFCKCHDRTVLDTMGRSAATALLFEKRRVIIIKGIGIVSVSLFFCLHFEKEYAIM